MDDSTKRALRAVDQAFYRDHAATFSATRTRPWSAFSRILAQAKAPLSVLDVGCGNGRFAATLAKEGATVAHYTGVDESAPLLNDAAAQTLPFPATFVRGDILLHERAGWLEERYNLVVVLGVLHHVPSATERRRLVGALATCVKPSGVLALSFFRYERSARIRRRLLDPTAVLSKPTFGDLQLEAGDYLMPFGHTGAMRYCHMFDDEELEQLGALPGVDLLDRFSPDDGSDALNEYLLLQRR